MQNKLLSYNKLLIHFLLTVLHINLVYVYVDPMFCDSSLEELYCLCIRLVLILLNFELMIYLCFCIAEFLWQKWHITVPIEKNDGDDI